MSLNIGKFMLSRRSAPRFADLPPVDRAGLYEIDIRGAVRRSGGTADKPWSVIKIDGSTRGSDPRRLSVLVNLPYLDGRGRQVVPDDLRALLFFLDLRNAEDEYVLDEPVRTERGRDASGDPYVFETYRQIVGRTLHLIVRPQGLGTAANGSGFAKYELVGICDRNGRSADEVWLGKAEAEEFGPALEEIAAAALPANDGGRAAEAAQ